MVDYGHGAQALHLEERVEAKGQAAQVDFGAVVGEAGQSDIGVESGEVDVIEVNPAPLAAWHPALME